MSSLAEIYYEKLINSENKVPVLINFFTVLFNPPSVGGLDYALFARLVRIYGDKLVFFSLLDMTEVETINLESYRGLLTYFIKKRFKEVTDTIPSYLLDNRVKEVEKSFNKKRKLKVRTEPFEETE